MAGKQWTDEMLDELASSVSEMRDDIKELRMAAQALLEISRQNQQRMDNFDQEVEKINDSIDGLRVTAQALLQVAAQSQRKMENFDEEMEKFDEEIELMKQQQAESDRRFNVLFEEVRYLIRGNQEES